MKSNAMFLSPNGSTLRPRRGCTSAFVGEATCTVCNVSHGWWRGQKNEQQNNVPNPKKPCIAAGYKGPVKIELFKGAALKLWVSSIQDAKIENGQR